MQQADCADSTAAAITSGGKFDKNSAPKMVAILSAVPLAEIHTPSDGLAVALDNVSTLLICAGDIADGAPDMVSITTQMRHLKAVLGIAIDELARAEACHKAMECVVDAHIERRAA